mmetsp:Transcript_113363/g.327398  ORF Transcript_113363/g.327398 Transcript_113363/m.327398 type:complete len:272 (+) Transcript_113363:229-1044(+)
MRRRRRHGPWLRVLPPGCPACTATCAALPVGRAPCAPGASWSQKPPAAQRCLRCLAWETRESEDTAAQHCSAAWSPREGMGTCPRSSAAEATSAKPAAGTGSPESRTVGRRSPRPTSAARPAARQRAALARLQAAPRNAACTLSTRSATAAPKSAAHMPTPARLQAAPRSAAHTTSTRSAAAAPKSAARMPTPARSEAAPRSAPRTWQTRSAAAARERSAAAAPGSMARMPEAAPRSVPRIEPARSEAAPRNMARMRSAYTGAAPRGMARS